MSRRVLIISCLTAGLLAAQLPQEDPVLRARAQRAAAQGIAEGDLPPVPRGVVEPPPLPPPEAHVKDTRRGRKARARGKKRGKSSAKAKPSAKRAPKASTKGKAR